VKKLHFSLIFIFLTLFLILISLILFLFDTTETEIDDTIILVKEDSTIEENFDYPKVLSTGANYLSEIKDLHDSLKEESSNGKIVATEDVPLSEIDLNMTLDEKNDIPKLVIIIDDVAFKYQVRQIHKLNLPITMSFFPPDKTHPHTAEFAKQEKNYMVHFPLEAINFHREEIDTLHIGDSYQKIKNRVDFILEQNNGVYDKKIRYFREVFGFTFICIVAAPEGVERIQQKHNDVAIITAAIDDHLNDKKFIVPGLGDFGDRYFGTEQPELA
jgi:hypothetical protein